MSDANKLTRCTRRVLFIICVCCVSSSVLAQAPTSENSGGSIEPDKTKTSPKPTNNTPAQSKAKPQDKVFKPSEEISEDSPVPFPVDI